MWLRPTILPRADVDEDHLTGEPKVPICKLLQSQFNDASTLERNVGTHAQMLKGIDVDRVSPTGQTHASM